MTLQTNKVTLKVGARYAESHRIGYQHINRCSISLFYSVRYYIGINSINLLISWNKIYLILNKFSLFYHSWYANMSSELSIKYNSNTQLFCAYCGINPALRPDTRNLRFMRLYLYNTLIYNKRKRNVAYSKKILN